MKRLICHIQSIVAGTKGMKNKENFYFWQVTDPRSKHVKIKWVSLSQAMIKSGDDSESAKSKSGDAQSIALNFEVYKIDWKILKCVNDLSDLTSPS